MYVARQLTASFDGNALLQRASLFEQLIHLIVLMREAHVITKSGVLLFY